MLYVCSLSKLGHVVDAVKASHMISVVNPEMAVTRPERILPENHLFLGMNDISVAMPGFEMGSRAQVEKMIAFLRAWDRSTPMVIHCWAGVSRSTASAFIAACALRPDVSELELARALREASPSATPNKKLVELADQLLGRKGRMSQAVHSIGRGADCYEGNVFAMPHIE
ncbi:tyrosine phosphatase family protein [Cohaesibacter celericrescens]|jgi:predicted protein tyrosine phosphatase|uniref:Protein tyrosine phosphatase n=1 Tax=Cohaesibacter celericrescens TaxID=2067669 RepID=A0A2N5XKZ7_9HYPH|nr:protein tyrosine phosphatase [Cohaesibacter celericrescens]PLW75183.1 protein tyrosine phosphatase [Cohaesibacter celericrescens]